MEQGRDDDEEKRRLREEEEHLEELAYAIAFSVFEYLLTREVVRRDDAFENQAFMVAAVGIMLGFVANSAWKLRQSCLGVRDFFYLCAFACVEAVFVLSMFLALLSLVVYIASLLFCLQIALLMWVVILVLSEAGPSVIRAHTRHVVSFLTFGLWSD